MDQSHAFLPADKVSQACRKAIQEIEDDRFNVLHDLVQDYRRRFFGVPIFTYSYAFRTLPEYIEEIAKLHRSDEEISIRNVLYLSAAAALDSPKFNVQIVNDEFALIGKYYE